MTAIGILRNRPIYYDDYMAVWRYMDTGNVAKSKKEWDNCHILSYSPLLYMKKIIEINCCPICGSVDSELNFVEVTNQGYFTGYWYCHFCRQIITLGDWRGKSKI